jgi:hypothetical protein
MSTAELARRTPLPGILWALVSGLYFALVGFLMIAAVDWQTRAILGFAALIPLMLVLLPLLVWRLVRGPAHWSFGSLHWLIFFSPTAALLALAAVTLMGGQSLS